MAHKNKVSLIKQAELELSSKLKIGSSKYQDKINGISQEYIYSWNTFRNYLQIACRFLTYCKNNYKVKRLADARPYVSEWLHTFDSCSPYTQKTYRSALGKLYGENLSDFCETAVRHREKITRSRRNVIRDKHFSDINNKELICFCRCTGLRRNELENIRGNQLLIKDEGYYLKVKGKGGKIRESLIVGSETEKLEVIKKMVEAGNEKVWGKVHNSADIHSWRHQYCQRVYTHFARPLSELSHAEKFFCRRDKKGVVYDKNAMKKASQMLGHTRISVISEHYLWEGRENEKN